MFGFCHNPSWTDLFCLWMLCSAPVCKVACSLCAAFWVTWSCYNPSLLFHGCAADIRDAVTLFFFMQFGVSLWLAPWAPGALSVRIGRKGANGVSTNGVTANFSFFDRGAFWVLPLTYFCLTQSARAYIFPQSVKIHDLCSSPMSVDPICPQPNRRE